MRGATARQEFTHKAEEFQSTRPMRGATSYSIVCSSSHRDISIHAPQAGRDVTKAKDAATPGKQISNHAPHTGRDKQNARSRGLCVISIHAPHTGRDLICAITHAVLELFQSTRPIRGATLESNIIVCVALYFNPRAPYGARRASGIFHELFWDNSIHAPHTWRDTGS